MWWCSVQDYVRICLGESAINVAAVRYFLKFIRLLLKSGVCWDVTRCSMPDIHRRFEGTYCLVFQGIRVSQELACFALLVCWPAAGLTLRHWKDFSETSVNVYWTTRRYIPPMWEPQIQHKLRLLHTRSVEHVTGVCGCTCVSRETYAQLYRRAQSNSSFTFVNVLSYFWYRG
jgi:hypothetical protein